MRIQGLVLAGALALLAGCVAELDDDESDDGAASVDALRANGTTLAASKTIDICAAPDGSWIYSGEVSVWNAGAVDTQGLAIQDCIQNKSGSGQFADVYCQALSVAEIRAGTSLETATVFPYRFAAAPLSGDIRNTARVTITNHSGRLGTRFGPEPKATWLGEVRPCPEDGGCVRTRGYWGHKPGVVWPEGYSRDAPFYLSGQTWQSMLNAQGGGSGYTILAPQLIAATLNAASGAALPEGVEDTLVRAQAWLAANAPSACSAPSSCGTQRTWAAILDDYNNGRYPGGPAHCGDE